MSRKILSHIGRDPVLYAALAAALISMLFVPPSLQYLDYLDVRVLCLLFSLMLVVAGLRQVGVFSLLIRALLRLVHNTRTLTLTLTGVCFFSSMLITNDVALLTFVPLALLLLTQTNQQRLIIPIIILQTLAANLGSILTPLGNPQNLYLYSLSHMSTTDFIALMARPTLLSLMLLLGATLIVRPERIAAPELPDNTAAPNTAQKTKTVCWILMFALCVLAVVRVVPYGAALAAVLAAALLLDAPLLRRVDYSLLLTFIFLFVFIGNLKHIPAVSLSLSTLVQGHELSTGILLSQVISNVPAAMLLSGFTNDYNTLLLGVNIGGLGTMIASMASIISYKQYAAQNGAQIGKYLLSFTIANIIFLAALWSMALLTA